VKTTSMPRVLHKEFCKRGAVPQGGVELQTTIGIPNGWGRDWA
jgi:hypothetical protein